MAEPSPVDDTRSLFHDVWGEAPDDRVVPSRRPPVMPRAGEDPTSEAGPGWASTSDARMHALAEEIDQLRHRIERLEGKTKKGLTEIRTSIERLAEELRAHTPTPAPDDQEA